MMHDVSLPAPSSSSGPSSSPASVLVLTRQARGAVTMQARGAVTMQARGAALLVVCSSAGSAGGSAGGGSTGGDGGGSNVRPLGSTFSQSDSGVIPIPTPFRCFNGS